MAETKPNPATEMVEIKHSKIEGTGRVSRLALDDIWKDKGWTEVKESSESRSTAADPK